MLGDWQLQFPAASLQLLLDHNLPTRVWNFSPIGSSEAGASLWLGRRVSPRVQVGLSAQSDASGFSEDRLWLQGLPCRLREDTVLQSKAAALLSPTGREPDGHISAQLWWGLWDPAALLADLFSRLAVLVPRGTRPPTLAFLFAVTHHVLLASTRAFRLPALVPMPLPPPCPRATFCPCLGQCQAPGELRPRADSPDHHHRTTVSFRVQLYLQLLRIGF